jgi:copper(I)-binding protein
MSLVDYIEEESQRLSGGAMPAADEASEEASPERAPGAAAGDVVAIMNAWVRQTDAEAKVNAGYLTLINVGAEDVVLTGVESPSYESIEVHEMKTVDGLMEMRQIAEMTIPAHGHVQLEPGGRHLMLRGPRQHFTAGDVVEMTLIFNSGRRQVLSVVVAAR